METRLKGFKTDLSSLNNRQRDAVVSEDKRVLVLAGAGSGKTKTLLQKLVYLIEEKSVSPSSILAITFTKNAANEMIDRLIMSADHSGGFHKIISDKNLSAPEKDQRRRSYAKRFKWIENVTLRTFHSFCYSVLRNYGVNEFDNKFKIIGDEKRNEDNELSKYIAPETAFEVFHKLLIELCDDSDYLLSLKRYFLIHCDKFNRKVSGKPDNSVLISRPLRHKGRSKSEPIFRIGLCHNLQSSMNTSNKDSDSPRIFYYRGK